MVTQIRRLFIASFLVAGLLSGQPLLHFKTRQIKTGSGIPVSEVGSLSGFGRRHLLIQFQTPPSAATIAELTNRGISVLQDVPDNGLLISLDRRVRVVDLGVTYSAPIAAADKISPMITAGGFMLVEFHPDVDMNRARGVILNLGISLLENPDLSRRHLLIQATDSAQVLALAQRDEVGYIFPASSDLVNGVPTRACAGALTTNGTTAQSIPTYGAGWDGPGLGAATVAYVFSKMTAQLDPATAEAAIQRAMAEWTKAVKVTWVPGASATAAGTVNILFATGDHGDGFPFDGPGGVLAHTFYPAPPNPEPIAGDMHFDDSETWKIGVNTDLFSVALHELGHSLGLGHSDDPTAVMYPYYKMATGLSPLDISTVQTLYAAQTATSAAPVTPPVTPPATPVVPPAATPVTLAVNAPASATTASSIAFSGSTAGGKGAIVVTWSSGQGNSGTASGAAAWNIVSVPLVVGSNVVTITATDSVSHVSQSFNVTRASTNTPPVVTPPTGSDNTAPSLTINSPSSTSISTSAASMAFTGTSSDNVGVKAVTWATNTGGAGTAVGTTQWSTSIPLLVGSNTVTICATDAAGNVAWRSVMVTRH